MPRKRFRPKLGALNGIRLPQHEVHVDVSVSLQGQPHPCLPDGVTPLLRLHVDTCAWWSVSNCQHFQRAWNWLLMRIVNLYVLCEPGKPGLIACRRHVRTAGVQQALVTRTRKRI